MKQSRTWNIIKVHRTLYILSRLLLAAVTCKYMNKHKQQTIKHNKMRNMTARLKKNIIVKPQTWQQIQLDNRTAISKTQQQICKDRCSMKIVEANRETWQQNPKKWQWSQKRNSKFGNIRVNFLKQHLIFWSSQGLGQDSGSFSLSASSEFSQYEFLMPEFSQTCKHNIL